MSWSWIIDDWKLKLLALGLSVLLLGAVAFSQNPPTTKTFDKDIAFTSEPANIILINPPTKTRVTVSGLADTISSVTARSVVAEFDLASVKPASGQVKVNLIVKSLISNVTIQNPIVPQALNVDQRATVKLPVEVRTPRVTSGWQVTKAEARCLDALCSVNFDGPASWEDHLKAYADWPDPVQNSSATLPNQPVQLEQNGKPLDLTRPTVPEAGLDITNVSIHVEAVTGTQFRQVALVDSPPSNPPPSGYRVTKISVDPITVLISGPASALARIDNISLPPLDLSGHTSDVTFRVQIPYPDQITGSVALARVTYSISANPNG